ncbi:cupin domain-containing protein [Marinobacteraceae bacterium S3BR75-40.1]
MNNICHLDALPLKTIKQGDGFEAHIAQLSPMVGARKLGYRYVELPPGKRGWPYHRHHSNEEMFVILEGRGTARIEDEEITIAAGCIVSALVGQAHQIINTGEQPLRYLAISTMVEPDIIEYPDSGKFVAFAGSAPGGDWAHRTFSHIGYEKDRVDYWEGE